MRHGTEHTYIAHDCRCDRCKKAAAVARRRRRKDANRRLLAGEVEVTHGKTSTYTYWGCRCEVCTKAMSDYYRDLDVRRRSGNYVPRKSGRKPQSQSLPQPVTLSPPAATGRLRRRLRKMLHAA